MQPTIGYWAKTQKAFLKSSYWYLLTNWSKINLSVNINMVIWEMKEASSEWNWDIVYHLWSDKWEEAALIELVASLLMQVFFTKYDNCCVRFL